jgi:type II secretory pathway pseudopilin PulG
MIEMMVVVAIVAILAALGAASVARQRPRANLASTASELHALLHGARLTAMANGTNVVVMVFPNFVTPGGGTGRFIVYEDGNYTFTSGNGGVPVTFGNYNPAARNADGRSQVLEVFDLHRDVRVGPATGMGATAALTAPLAGIPVNVACSFCSGAGDGRGALVFDPRGRATFYSQNGAPLPVASGGSLSIFSRELLRGTHTLVITNATGAVRTFHSG